jgi:hypothetical protein
VRTPAAASLALVLVCLFAAPAAAATTDTPAVAAEDFPALRPIAPEPPATTSRTASAGGVDERVLVAAMYWLVIGGLALRRRITRRIEEESAVPVAGWVLAHGPPLPR